jgi:hypothetical protein
MICRPYADTEIPWGEMSKKMAQALDRIASNGTCECDPGFPRPGPGNLPLAMTTLGRLASRGCWPAARCIDARVIARIGTSAVRVRYCCHER